MDEMVADKCRESNDRCDRELVELGFVLDGAEPTPRKDYED